MKELKIVCLSLTTLVIIIGVGFYCWSTWEKQMFYSREQKCIERCWPKIKELKSISGEEKLKTCKTICNYLPNSF